MANLSDYVRSLSQFNPRISIEKLRETFCDEEILNAFQMNVLQYNQEEGVNIPNTQENSSSLAKYLLQILCQEGRVSIEDFVLQYSDKFGTSLEKARIHLLFALSEDQIGYNTSQGLFLI